jgi:carbohydrate-selective porin OprB
MDSATAVTSFKGGNPQPFKVDVPVHLEAFYRYQFNNNISLTPGLIWLLAPNQDRDNASDVIGVLRTTFVF